MHWYKVLVVKTKFSFLDELQNSKMHTCVTANVAV